MVGEFIGTTMFLFFAFAGTEIANLNNANPTPQTASPNSQTANNSTTSTVNTANLMFIALAFGFSLMVNVWVFFRISGGLFNPAISLALALVKIISPFRAALLVFAQVLGGITAAALVNVLLPESLYVRTTLGGGISVAQGTAANESRVDFRLVLGDVYDCRVGFRGLHACGRETQGDVFGPCWNWYRIVHGGDGRSLLHWWKSQSSSQSRS